MESKSSENEREEMPKRDWVKTSVMILLIVAIGTFAVNQVLEYHYKAEFLKSPCMLCRELNPDVSACLTYAGTITQFWNASGGWS